MMTRNEKTIIRLKVEIFDLLERQEMLNQESRQLDLLKQKKLEELNNIRRQMMIKKNG